MMPPASTRSLRFSNAAYAALAAVLVVVVVLMVALPQWLDGAAASQVMAAMAIMAAIVSFLCVPIVCGEIGRGEVDANGVSFRPLFGPARGLTWDDVQQVRFFGPGVQLLAPGQRISLAWANFDDAGAGRELVMQQLRRRFDLADVDPPTRERVNISRIVLVCLVIAVPLLASALPILWMPERLGGWANVWVAVVMGTGLVALALIALRKTRQSRTCGMARLRQRLTEPVV